MRILVVGATGTIGGAVSRALAARGHEVVATHRGAEDFPIDITVPESISTAMEKIGDLDAVVCAAGTTPFAPWDEIDRDAFQQGLSQKLFGQVELVWRARQHVRQGGSFTLVSGILGREPISRGSVAAAVNGALEAWVVASARELWGQHRVNIVSPTVLTESLANYSSVMPGFHPVDAVEVAQAFVRSVETLESGQVYTF